MAARRKHTRRSRTAAKTVFRRDSGTLASLAAAQVITSDKNPFFRRARSGGLREQDAALQKTIATARAQQQLLASAWKKARVSRRDAGKLLVIDAATGKRYPALLKVPKGRKIFVAKVDKLGRRRLYNPIDSRTLARGVQPQKKALKLGEFDWRPLSRAEPRKFREIMTELAAQAKRLPSSWKFTDEVFSARAQRGEVDRIAQRMAALYKQAVTGQADHTQWQVEFNVMLKGQRKVIPLRMDPLRSYQFFTLAGGGRNRRLVPVGRQSMALLRRVIAYKLRDVMRRALAERGLVSTASARRVRALEANRGKPRRKWRNAQGAPWAGAHREDVAVEALEFQLRRIL